MLLIEIDHIQIAAPKGCEEVARFFFGSLLKLEEIEKPEALRARGGCWFRVGSRQLHIGVEEDFRPARKAHVAFAVPKDEIEQVFVRLTMDGVPCQWDNAIDGIRRFYTSDPWGNRLEFTEPTYESISDPAGIRFRSLGFCRRRIGLRLRSSFEIKSSHRQFFSLSARFLLILLLFGGGKHHIAGTRDPWILTLTRY